MITIPRCYDSHLHLVSTGEWLQPEARRGHWLLKFGWEVRPSLEPYKNELIAFSRIDGHAVLLNEPAMKELGFWKKKAEWSAELQQYVEFSPEGWPTGLFFDRALEIAFQKIPAMTNDQIKSAAEAAVDMFCRQGFTHLREMMADRQTWNVLQRIDEDRDLKAYLEVNFHCPTLKRLASVLKEYSDARAYKSARLRVDGIKFFVDGAMGSEGALLTEPYATGKCNHGFQLWQEQELEEGFAKCWEQGIPVAVHAIGDRAVNLTLTVAQTLLKKGVSGLLHLEHLQMMNPKDIALFKDLSVYSHFQPSHFLSDKKWIKEKLGDRADWVFPWKTLERYGYPFFFGSDSPIERPSLKKTREGLTARAKWNSVELEMDWTFPHSHPDATFGKKCSTTVDVDGSVLAVVLDGERII